MTRNLTNLECVALAHLWKMGASTGHELRQAFGTSAAGRYSGSAGAIYPLLKRLEKSGHIGSRAARNGEQKKRLYALRAKGEAAAQQWMCELDPRETFADDPIRTRFQYIRMLDAKAQVEWFDGAIKSLDEQDAMLKDEYRAEEYNNPVDRAVMTGILESNRMRRRWLKRARASIS